MTINIMNQYIELTKKQINSYMKLVFGNKFNKQYVDIYTDKYINIRYCNYSVMNYWLQIAFDFHVRIFINKILNRIK